MPFTYFLVEKIERHEEYDEVWLSEMPTPFSFKHNFIIWVDDVPSNNIKYVADIAERGIETIQLTSTVMAAKWTAEFGWLLNWMDVKFKVISDMVRKEGEVFNYEAGIDLLEHFYNIQGYSIPVFIFCSDAKKGKENAEKRNIRKNNIYAISNSSKELR